MQWIKITQRGPSFFPVFGGFGQLLPGILFAVEDLFFNASSPVKKKVQLFRTLARNGSGIGKVKGTILTPLKFRSFNLRTVAVLLFLAGFARAQTATPTCGSYQNSIHFDNSISYSSNRAMASAVTLSFNAVPPTVSNTLLLLQVQIGDAINDVSGATYNGVALTNIRQDTSTTTYDTLETWYLPNPTTGIHSLVLNFTGRCTFHVGTVTYDGVNPTAPIGAEVFSTNGSALAQTITVSTIADNSVIASMCDIYAGGAVVSPGTGQNQRWLQSDNDPTEGDDKATTLAGNNTMTYSFSAKQASAIQAVEIVPYSCGYVAPTLTPSPTATLTTTNTA